MVGAYAVGAGLAVGLILAGDNGADPYLTSTDRAAARALVGVAGLGAFPARRVVARIERLGVVETRAAEAVCPAQIVAAIGRRHGVHIDVGGGQFVDEA